jgi:hypothetical protein
MNKTVIALALVICVAAAVTVVVYVVKLRQPAPAQKDEFSSVDDQLKELDDFLSFENQFDDDLGSIAGDWG